MKSKQFLILTCLLSFFAASCDKKPLERLMEPGTYTPSGQWGNTWVVYDDELRTDGGVMFIGWGDGFSVDFNWHENPYKGAKCVKVSWNGSNVNTNNGITDDFTGFSLIVAKDYNDYLSTAKDLSGGGYNKVRFYARKEFLSSNTVLRLESPAGNENSVYPNNAWEGTPGSEWQEYSFDITGSIASARHFVNIVLKAADGNTGNGGIIYLDNVSLVKE